MHDVLTQYMIQTFKYFLCTNLFDIVWLGFAGVVKACSRLLSFSTSIFQVWKQETEACWVRENTHLQDHVLHLLSSILFTQNSVSQWFLPSKNFLTFKDLKTVLRSCIFRMAEIMSIHQTVTIYPFHGTCHQPCLFHDLFIYFNFR